MKVAVITRHAISNYGSILQCLALQFSIESLGYQTEIIDYIRDDEDYHKITKTLVQKSTFWRKNIFRRTLYYIIQKPMNLLSGSKFRKLQKQYLNLTERLYRSFDELKIYPPDADIYCTGSDQVWGTIGLSNYDSAYFLEFLSKPYKKCITYAASFGKTNLDKEAMIHYEKLLAKYDSILLRESSAIDLLDSLGFNNCNHVTDPTLLLSAEKWADLLHMNKRKEKYILVYQLHKNKEMDYYAKRVAKKYNMKLIRVSPFLHHFVRGGSFKYLPNLGRFLEYIMNAQFMITDSFHGTAFAINFNVQFVDFYPGETSTRIQSLLRIFQLEDRVVSDSSIISQFEKKIDFTKTNLLLQKEREKSLLLLKNALQEK